MPVDIILLATVPWAVIAMIKLRHPRCAAHPCAKCREHLNNLNQSGRM